MSSADAEQPRPLIASDRPLGQSPFAPQPPAVEHYRPPRLGIIHLLAWTAATAVLLKYNLALEMVRDFDVTGPEKMFHQASNLIHSMVFGAGMVGLGVLLLARARGPVGRLQPGHWIVIIDTAAAVAGFAFVAVHTWVTSVWLDSDSLWWVLFVVIGAIRISRAGLYTIALWRSRDGKCWRVCLGVSAACGMIEGLFYFAVAGGMSFRPWAMSLLALHIVLGAVLLLAFSLDLRSGLRRDWLHWLGAGMLAACGLLNVMWQVYITWFA